MSPDTLKPVNAQSGDIQVIGRCAQLLCLFSTAQRSLRVSDVGPEVGLQRTTVHRYLSSLANAGFLERDDDGAYRLGPLLVQLGTIALHSLRVLEISGPRCQALADEANETTVIAVWGGLGPVVARMHEAIDRQVNITVRVGSPLPLDAAQSLVHLAFHRDTHLTSRLLARLSDPHRRQITSDIRQVRDDGYAINSQVVQGIRAIAAPILDGHGQICATVAVVGTVSSVSDAPDSGILLATLRTAEQISRDLGWMGALPFDEHLQATESAS